MPTKPTTNYTWATNANYSGGPAVGTPSKSVPSAGRQLEGYEPGYSPPAQEHNELFSNIFLWLAFVNGLFGSTGHLTELDSFLSTLNARTITRSRLPTLWSASNWSQGTNLSTYLNNSIQCTTLASNAAPIELDIPALHVLKSITITAKASAGGQGIQLGLFTNQTAAVAGVTLYPATSIGSVTTTSTDFTLRFDASVNQSMTAQTTTNGSGVTPNVYTFTRATGSFVTDGFLVGHLVNSSGWGIAEHNFTGGQVLTVSALTMTVQQPNPPVASASGSAETLVATIACTPVTTPANGGSLYAILFATGSAGVAVANIAYTHQAPSIVFP